jgi:ankyrin repeat protein
MEYKSLKNIFTVFFIVANFVSVIDKIPILGIANSNLNQLTKLAICSFFYFFTILHLFSERENLKFKFELRLNTLLYVSVCIILFWDFVKIYKYELLSSFIYILIFSYFSYLSISELPYIRSKKESKSLNLPRVPVSVFSVLLMSFIIITVFTYFWYKFNKDKLNFAFITENIIFLIIIPSICFLLFFLSDELIILLKLKGWEEKNKIKESMKEAKLSHDMDYEFFSNFSSFKPNEESIRIYTYIINSNIEEIDKFYEFGYDPNKIFSHGYTSLIFASANGKLKSLIKIIEHGADLNIKNSKGRTALFFACKYNYFEIVKVLLDNGANPNVTFNSSDTPLQIASINNSIESIELLLKNSEIEIERKNLYNKTALDLAMENKNGKIAKLIRTKMKN